MPFLHTTRYRRGNLPHWEVDGGRYFVTVRLADSIPRDAALRLSEIHRSLAATTAQSSSFAALQRQYFHSMEKYLDAGVGECLLARPANAKLVINELVSLSEWFVAVPHYTIMPNHWHALLVPESRCPCSISQIMKRVKGRTGKQIRANHPGAGPIWQREWFDRWMRGEAEWAKTVCYIQNNPIKARLASKLNEHPWTK